MSRHSLRIAAAVLGTVVLFAIAVAALLSHKVGMAPWELGWLEDGRPSSLALALIHESRFELLALGLAALNVPLLLGIGRREIPLDSADVSRVIPATRLDEADEVESGEDMAPTDKTLNTETVAQTSSGGNVQAQLEIAAAEVTRLRRELATSQRQLDVASNAKSQFLANMSHELRTPMNGIMGMTDLLLGGELPARERRFVQSIAQSSNTLLAIISDLLDFSRIESGTLYLERSRFRVQDAVEDVCALHAETAHDKGIELMCYVDENVPTLADGDSSRLRQVLDNLIRNAIQHTDNGEVVVRMSQISKSGVNAVYRCDVQDTGGGISPELQMTMFDAFTQADNSITREQGGLGMGLTITRELVALMGGEVTFRSRLGEGTRFGFTFELDNVDSESEEDQVRRPIRGARVLIVDDNETNRTILYHQLSGWGIIADTVESGQSALENMHAAVAAGEPYDMLVLDLHMPGMDGVELARRIYADPALSGIKSLMLTSALLDLETDELSSLGIDRYVSKPPRQSVLHESLLSLLPSGQMSARADISREKRIVPVSAVVLLAEDNVVSQDVGIGLLEGVGCEVELATDGREVIERASRTTYDLILMDCKMPGTDGFEATRAIRTGDGPNKKTPIIALTAHALEGDRERCIEVGMNDYLAKPVRRDDLHVLLKRWVTMHAPSAVDASPDVVLEIEPDAASVATTSIGVAVADATPADTVAAEQVPAASEAVSEASVDTSDSATQDRVSKASLVNPDAIESIRSLQRPGKPDLVARVLDIYFARTPEAIEAMQAALVSNDTTALREQAHSLKSSSAYVGAEGISTSCSRIEKAASEDKFDELSALVAAIERDYAVVEQELGQLSAA